MDPSAHFVFISLPLMTVGHPQARQSYFYVSHFQRKLAHAQIPTRKKDHAFSARTTKAATGISSAVVNAVGNRCQVNEIVTHSHVTVSPIVKCAILSSFAGTP